MLEKTQETLIKYRNLKREEFYECAADFKPFDSRNGGSYGNFDEVADIYALMKTHAIQLDQQIYYGSYDNAYSNPLEPINEIQGLIDNLRENILWLESINKKHDGKILPVIATLNNYRKTERVLNYVLNLDEVKTELVDTEKEKLKSELIALKTEKIFRKKQLKMFLIFAFYALFLIVPVLIIIVLWNNHQNGKWFQLGLALFPVISFLYDREAFINVVKFVFTKKYRRHCKEEITQNIKNNYA